MGKNTLRHLAVFTGLLLGNCFSGLSQDTTNTIGKVNISSPNAAALGKYGDIPVSYNTGIPQVSVPLYTVKSNNLSLPISLSYHAGGLKVQEQASWVGAGWSLNAGGAITRSVMGAPDDRGASTNNTLKGHFTDYGFNSYWTGTNTDDVNLARGFFDGEPDLYFFNFGGYSGKFYFNDDRTPMLVPEQDLKIQPYLQGTTSFAGFVVTTPDGVRYYFGKTGNTGSVDPVETTTPSTAQNGPAYTTAAVSAWFLNKIVSADGTDSISLAYQAESYSYYTLSTAPMLSTDYQPGTSDKMGINLVKNFVSGVRLSQISSSNGSVSFTKAASPRSDLSAGIESGNGLYDAANTTTFPLGSITITNGDGFCKKDSFYYSYFYDSSPLSSAYFSAYSLANLHSDQYLLRLDSVQELSCDGTIKVPPHRFSYFTEAVPRRLSFGVDHWGYANGANGNAGLVPTYTVITGTTSTIVNGANRDASWPAMRGGVLQQITYPTGGTTSFDFEPKLTQTFTSTVRQNVPVSSMLVVHEYGQSNTTGTVTFTAASSDNYNLEIRNSSVNYSPTFTIKNSVGTTVYNSGLIPFALSQYQPYTFNTTVSLPAGAYTATLSFPSNATLSTGQGADAVVKQWQDVPVQTTQAIGGLRIKTITTTDGLTASNNVTSYQYAASSTSSGGLLYSVPVYLQVIRNDQNKLVWTQSCSPNGCASCDGYNEHSYFVSAGSIRPMATLQGENVGYPEVDVVQTGNGRSVYRYYGADPWSSKPLNDVCVRSLTQSSLCDVTIPTFPAAPLPFEFLRGELKYESHSSETALLKEAWHYPVFTLNPMTTPAHISVNQPGLYSFTEYQLQTAAKTQQKTVSTTYDPATGTPLTQTSISYYSSPYHHAPTRTVTTTSNGDSLVTTTKYAFDFRLSGCDNIPDSLTYYQSRVHADTLWLNDSINICTPQNNLSTNCRWAVFTRFRQKMAQDRMTFIGYRRRNYTDNPNTLSSCYAAAKQNADALLKPILELQSEYVNAPIEVASWRNTSLLHATYTGYDVNFSPLGYAYPSQSQAINLQTASATFTGASVSGTTIVKDSRYTTESTYQFSGGNPLQVTPRSGVTTAYIWDYSNTQPVASVSGAASNQIAYTSFEKDGTGGWSGINTGAIQLTGGLTGGKYYNQTGFTLSKAGLVSTTSYIVSYWSKNGAYTVGGTQSGYPKTLTSVTLNGTTWTLYEHLVSGQSSVSVSGSGSIDELRLFPQGAMMTTYTYTPLVGISSQCDAAGHLLFYDYDPIGRLSVVRDQSGNVVKKYEYAYVQPVNP